MKNLKFAITLLIALIFCAAPAAAQQLNNRLSFWGGSQDGAAYPAGIFYQHECMLTLNGAAFKLALLGQAGMNLTFLHTTPPPAVPQGQPDQEDLATWRPIRLQGGFAAYTGRMRAHILAGNGLEAGAQFKVSPHLFAGVGYQNYKLASSARPLAGKDVTPWITRGDITAHAQARLRNVVLCATLGKPTAAPLRSCSVFLSLGVYF